MAFCNGVHLNLFLLTPEVGKRVTTARDFNFFHQCLESYLKAHQTRQSGLTTSYIAVVGSSNLLKTEQHLDSCEWHRLPHLSSSVRHAPLFDRPLLPDSTHQQSSDNLNTSSALERIIEVLHLHSLGQDIASCHGDACERDEMGATIHSLLDNLPACINRENSYSVMDIHWLVPDPALIPSPSSMIGLYGSLLRLQEWHNAHINIITPDHLPTLPVLSAWRETLSPLPVCSVEVWEPPVGVVWRGAIHCTEHKVCKQATHRTLSFHGFTLELLPLQAPPISLVYPDDNLTPGDILEGVGLKINSSFHLTHLEVLQIVDMATMPLFWISPLKCKLTLSSDSDTASQGLFHNLLTSRDDGQVGIIMCLCTQSHDNRLFETSTKQSHKTETGHSSSFSSPQTGLTSSHRPIRSKTTAEWVEFIQGLEDEVIQKDKTPTPLLAYGTGPRLLATPSTLLPSNRVMSCDAWLLWKPDAINAEVFTRMSSEQLEVANDKDGETILSSLGFSDDSTHPLLMDKLKQRFRKIPNELEVPPSDWSELKALKTYEWIQRKMIRRIATPDLMFGHMVAPPPRDVTSQLESLDIGDVLSCFNDHGSPVTSELSPIAMSGSSRLTKVHVPDPKLSYNMIIASTPSSKKQYHGVSYCLTDEDTSIDSKLTKIQQRYLFSERASHCNPIITPKAERAKQQARRMRIDQAVALSQNKEHETVSMETEPNPATSSSLPERTPVKKQTSHSRKTFSQSKTNLNILKSPVIKIPKLQPRHTVTVKSERLKSKLNKKDASVSISTSSSGKESNYIDTPLQQEAGQTASSNVKTSLPDSMTKISADAPISDGGSEPQDEPVSPSNSVATNKKILRRSPRTKKWWTKTEDSSGVDSFHGDDLGRRKEKRKEKNESLKAKLGIQVVASLKSQDMPRSHPHFKMCFTRLFNISKSFLKDLDMKTLKGAAAMREEIKRVVEFNAEQVVSFERRRNLKT